MGMNVGSFAGGLIQGYSAGLELKGKIDDRKERDKKKAEEADVLNAGKAAFDGFGKPAPDAAPAKTNFGFGLDSLPSSKPAQAAPIIDDKSIQVGQVTDVKKPSARRL